MGTWAAEKRSGKGSPFWLRDPLRITPASTTQPFSGRTLRVGWSVGHALVHLPLLKAVEVEPTQQANVPQVKADGMTDWLARRVGHTSNSKAILKATIRDSTGLKHRTCISCRSAELEGFEDCCFPDVRGGHGSGLVGTHERRIWHGRYRRACDRRLYGRLSLRLSRGLSGRGGRETTKAPARGERRTGQATSPGEGLIRSCSRGMRVRFLEIRKSSRWSL
jgi:hypothetical protein